MPLRQIIQKYYFLVLGIFAMALMVISTAFELVGTDDDDDGDDSDLDAPAGRTEAQIDALQDNIDEVIETAAFYSAFSVLLLVLVLWAIAQRSAARGVYAALALLTLWWFAVLEQNATGLYWSGLSLSGAASVAAGFALATITALAAAYFAPSRRLRRICLVISGALPVLWLVSRSLDVEVQLWIAAGAYAGAAFLHALPLSRGAWIAQWAKAHWRGLLLALVFLVWAAIVFGEVHEEQDYAFGGRILVGVVATVFILLFLARTIVVQQERDQAQRDALASALRQAELNEALLEAEKQYAEAQKIARARSRQLAAASHDIRQPITALRSTMEAALRNEQGKVRAQMNAAFDYLNDLAGTYIAQAQEEEDQNADPRALEVLDVSLVAQTVERMFASDAAERGQQLRVDVAQADIQADPLKLMRVMSNLVSNAIVHGAPGPVALIGRAESGSYLFEVTNETRDAETLDVAALFEPNVKGPGSGGEGLGLSIVRDIAQAQGFDVQATLSEGTFRVSLKIPD